jgi:hypothetical protein
MAQLREPQQRWHIWVSLLSGILTGYVLLIALVFGLN